MLKEIFKKHNLEKLLGVFHLINGILKKNYSYKRKF